MSESRASRRAHQRGNGPTPPQRRDPMTFVYAGFVVVFVIVIAGFGLMRWQQQNALNAAYATPTPMPSASGAPSPIPLVDGTAIGKPLIPVGKLMTDTAQGGHGQPIDGIQCAGMEYATLHVHPHLAIFYKGTQVQVPRLIGGAPSPTNPQQGCLYWIHTHDQTGLIHIESPVLAPEGASGYTLGMLFDIWGQPLDRSNVAGLKGPVTAYVNGVKYDGELRAIELRAHAQITLEVGTPVVTPPVYEFPPNE